VNINTTGLTTYNQVQGTGCIYPAATLTIADQLAASGKTWKGYMEDMGNDTTREGATCGQPSGGIGAPDNTSAAQVPPAFNKGGTQAVTDQYAARHNPFVYFHSLLDSGACVSHVVPLNTNTLPNDPASIATTPNYVFITPNLCNDGHDVPCKTPASPSTYVNENAFLQKWVPMIVHSPAFQQDGLLIITFDESSPSPNAIDGSFTVFDGTACCNEPERSEYATARRSGCGGNLRHVDHRRRRQQRRRSNRHDPRLAVHQARHDHDGRVQSLLDAARDRRLLRRELSRLRRFPRHDGLRLRRIRPDDQPLQHQPLMRALLAVVLTLVLGAAASAATASDRSNAEAAFLRTVNPRNTANVVTGDLSAYAGTHVAYTCVVDAIVREDVILGQCGSEAEPMDLFVRLPTAHLRFGERLRVLGILERPASWADITGHTVYYAFLRAVHVDHLH
jgi:hypothetical protein